LERKISFMRLKHIRKENEDLVNKDADAINKSFA